MSWNEGYVTDTTYTYGYYGTLNPLRIKLCFLAQKLLPPKIENACELGFGQGITLNFNAASGNAKWFGTDFNSSQASFARHLASITQAPVQIFDDSFGELLERQDLPQFDFIALHGIYSWISPEIRKQINDFIRKKLTVGGVCLISYNCQPGWAAMAPLRDFLKAYSLNLTPTGKPSPDRAKEGLDFVGNLMQLPSAEAIKSPQATQMLQTLQKMDSTYLAHELLNEYHTPFNFAQMQEQLCDTKLDFASYASYATHLTNIQLTDAEIQMLSQVSYNRPIYEMLKDLMFATSFRSDYWAKGVIRLNDSQCEEELKKLKIVLVIPESKINYDIQTHRGTLTLNEDFYTPILEHLKDNEPKSVQEVQEVLKQKLKKEVKLTQMLEALIALSHKDYIKLAQEEDKIQEAIPYTQRLNAYILKESFKSTNPINYLLSPITAEAVSLNRFEMMAVHASTQAKTQEEQVEMIFEHLKDQQGNILKDGKPLEATEIKDELSKQVKNIQPWLEVFKKLKILQPMGGGGHKITFHQPAFDSPLLLGEHSQTSLSSPHPLETKNKTIL